MSDDKDLRSRIGRKLLRKDKQPAHSMSASTSSLALPERFRQTEKESEEDTAALADNMHQSIFQMITTAGAKVDFRSRFGQEDSSSDEESEKNSRASSRSSSRRTNRRLSPTPAENKRMYQSMMTLRPRPTQQRPKTLPRKSIDSTRAQSPDSEDASGIRLDQQIIQARDKVIGNVMQEKEAEVAAKSRDPEGVKNLAKKIQEVFQLPKEEEIISGKYSSVLFLNPANNI